MKIPFSRPLNPTGEAVFVHFRSVFGKPLVLDTITTRFLILFLFLLAIPIVTITIFTVSLFASYLDAASENQLVLSQNLLNDAMATANENMSILERARLRSSHPEIASSRSMDEGHCPDLGMGLCIALDYTKKRLLVGDSSQRPLARLPELSPDLPVNRPAHPWPIFSFGRMQGELQMLFSRDSGMRNTLLFSAIPLDAAFLNRVYRENPHLGTEIWIRLESSTPGEAPRWVHRSQTGLNRADEQFLYRTGLFKWSEEKGDNQEVPLRTTSVKVVTTPLYGANATRIATVFHMIPLERNRQLLGTYYVGIYIISLASLLFSVLLAMVAGRTITQPLLRLIRDVNTLSRETVQRSQNEVTVAGVYEIRQLGEAFNRMIRRLQQEQTIKDDFVATLTHDLKVPLLAEKQTLHYLMNHTYGPLNEEQSEVLDVLSSSNRSCLGLVNGLLEVYRYNSGAVNLFLEAFDIAELLKECCTELSSLSREKNISLDYYIDPDASEECLVFADRLEIKRVLHNLISNAIINTPVKGKIVCKISDAANLGSEALYKVSGFQYTTLKYPLQLAGRLLISVQDSGIGFSNDDLASLFKQFAASKGRNPMSIGLGLYNCHQVLKAHNGILWVESTEGEGSLVGFILPKNKQAARDRRIFRDRRRQS